MELCCLNENNFQEIKDHPIYLIRYSEEHLQELCDAYDIIGQIRGVVDDYKRKQGTRKFRDHVFEVMGEEGFSLLPEGAVLLIAGYWPKEDFLWMETVKEVSERFDKVYFFPDKELKYDISYREKYKNKPLSNLILFRSGPGISHQTVGMDFTDNARALFEYMLRNGYDEKYKMVWLVKDPEIYKAAYSHRSNVCFLPYEGAVSDDEGLRDAYYEALCLAKYIFVTDGCVFARNARKDQIRIQLWHGHGFKQLISRMREEYRYEYMTVGCQLYANVHVNTFGLRPDQFLITGQPKEDLLFHPIPDWKSRCHIPDAKKYIFWLPTFRTLERTGARFWGEKEIHPETGLPILASSDYLKKINELLKNLDVLLVLKLHPLQSRAVVADWNFSNMKILENDVLVKEDIQINELLGHADALISDYSSAAVDYLLLDRPIAFTLDDYQEFENHRGFLWPNLRDYLPGVELNDFDDFCSFIKEIADEKDSSKEKRQGLRKKMHDFFDDRNCERVLKALHIYEGS